MIDQVVNELRRDIEDTRHAIEGLLEEYAFLIDQDMAGVISSYVRALHLDVELALSSGSDGELGRILEDMRELHEDTRQRLLDGRKEMTIGAPIES